jgi:hypothetical protein
MTDEADKIFPAHHTLMMGVEMVSNSWLMAREDSVNMNHLESRLA